MVSCRGMEDLFGLKFEMGCQASFRDGAETQAFSRCATTESDLP